VRRLGGILSLAAVLAYVAFSIAPIWWVAMTAIKDPVEVAEATPTFLPGPAPDPTATRDRGLTFTPYWRNFVDIFVAEERWWVRPDGSPSFSAPGPDDVGWTAQVDYERTDFLANLINSVIIAGLSTFIAVAMGTLAAYGFSRFTIAGAKDWLFFILSTRMLPPVVVAVPIFLMFSRLGLKDTHLGLIIIYTVFNISFAVWMMKGFMDEIPKEYEEAAVVDGYTRMQAFWKVVLPQAWTGIAATAVFCLITAWNEYAFALILTNEVAKTAPVTIAGFKGGSLGIEWGKMAASSLVFMAPVVVFTFLMRDHLLRGITFGAIKK